MAVLLGLVVAGLFLPVKIPYELVSTGNVTPLEEWRLTQNTGGGLLAVRRHFHTGMMSKVAAWQFQGGYLSGMELAVRVDTVSFIHQGDTVLRFFSSQILEEMGMLEQELHVRLAEREMLRTGEKPEMVEEAESRLRFALEQLALAEKQFAINEPLYRDGVIARVTYDSSKNALELARIAVRTAEKTLAVVSTGAKAETVGVNQAQIESLQSRLQLLRQRHANYIVTAPFDALVTPVQLPEEVMILQNVERYLVQIPVRLADLRYIGPSSSFRITDQASGRTYPAEMLEIGKSTQVIGGQQVNFVLAAVRPEPGLPINPGLSAQCIVNCDLLTPYEYLTRLLGASIMVK
jgi:hypothetical protein